MAGQIRDKSGDAGLWGAVLLHVWWFALPLGMAMYLAAGGGSQKRPKKTRPKTPRQLQKEQDIQATEREIDALVAEFHRRLPRELCETVGAIYARYSTKFQGSIADQVRTLLEFALAHKIYIPRELIFADYAVRGCKESRPGFNRLKEAVEKKQFQILLVFSTNRLYRKGYKSVRYVEEELVERGLRCIFVSQGIDTSDSKMWRSKFQLNAMMDEAYASANADNIRAAHMGMSREAIVVSTIPFGYAGDPIPGRLTKRNRPLCRLIIDLIASKFVLQAFHWFVYDHLTMDEIARRFNDDPLVPPLPKSTDQTWTHKAVKGLLTNHRYSGFMIYGESETRWQSKADYARQFRRKEPLQVEYFESLRIISNELWLKAQERLANLPTNRGRKSGKPAGVKTPRILTGIFRCVVHDRQLYCGGENGGILFCKDCRQLMPDKRPLFTLLNRRLAIRMFIEVVQNLVMNDDQLVDMVISACQSAAQEFQKPDEQLLQSLKAKNNEFGRAIDFATRHPGESECEMQETAKRVSQLRAERARIQAQLGVLEAADRVPPCVPTAEEVQAELGNLRAVICDPSEENEGAVRHLVRLLTGGVIEVVQMGERKKRRGWVRGTFQCPLVKVISDRLGVSIPETEGTEVVIDFLRSNPLDAAADRVKELLDTGILAKEAATILGCSRAQITKLNRHWHSVRGLPFPDGRKRRSLLARKHLVPPPHIALADPVMELYHKNVKLGAIAKQLGISLNLVTEAVRYWHESRGLPVPDGRTRRKTIREANEAADDQGDQAA